MSTPASGLRRTQNGNPLPSQVAAPLELVEALLSSPIIDAQSYGYKLRHVLGKGSVDGMPKAIAL
eukprot:1154756-Pelagomonas_calceolata.AAC.3